jgi:RNA polymerase sigma factor (sigma-70 family)
MGDWTILNLGQATPEKCRENKRALMHLSEEKTKKIKSLQTEYLKAKKLNDFESHATIMTKIGRLEDDRAHINSMISDLQYIIDWLSSGRRPGSRRGIERRSVQQRSEVWEPSWFDTYVSPAGWAVERELSSNERFQIEDALSTLSKRERQCYTLHHAMGFSYRQIAMELLISRSSVQTNIERAERKIQENKKSSLFLMV